MDTLRRVGKSHINSLCATAAFTIDRCEWHYTSIPVVELIYVQNLSNIQFLLREDDVEYRIIQ